MDFYQIIQSFLIDSGQKAKKKPRILLRFSYQSQFRSYKQNNS